MKIEIPARSNLGSIDNQLQTDQVGNTLKNDKEVVKPNINVVEITQTKKLSEEIPVTEISRAKIEEAVGKLQDYADQYKRRLQFSIDEDSGRTIVRLLDSENKVLRQIPSEEVLSLAQSLDNHKGGLFEGQV